MIAQEAFVPLDQTLDIGDVQVDACRPIEQFQCRFSLFGEEIYRLLFLIYFQLIL